MALTEKSSPELLKRVFLAGLGVDESRPLEFSFPVYALSLLDLAKAADPLRPKALGWQFLSRDPKAGFVAGEVPNADNAEVPILSSLTRGTATSVSWDAYNEIKKHPELQADPFDLRRLRISPLRVDAFWLKAPPADDTIEATDRFYTFLTFQDELKSKLLPAPEFLKILRQMAEKAMNQKEPPRRIYMKTHG